YKIQASTDSVTWVDVTGTLTYNNTQTSVSGGYSTYNSNIAALAGNSNVYHYYRIFGINVTSGNGWATELYFEEYTCNNPDTDNDNVPNRLDTDSDGDGCSDAFEAGATTSTTASYQFTGTDANNNGLIDEIQKGTSDSINYVSDYKKYAINNLVNACADTDSDGANDINDLDDDNDGVLDAIEAPACYYNSTEAMKAVSVSSSMISRVNNVSIVEGEDIPTLRDGSTANSGAANHNIGSGQSFANVNIYTIKYPTAVNLNSLSVTGGTGNWGTGTAATLYGSNDSTIWTLLMSDPQSTTSGAVKTFTVNQNAAQYRYYQLRGTAGTSTSITNYEVGGALNAGTYNPSAHPKDTCTVDADSDGIVNARDLDSDGDGCTDAVEADVAKSSGGPTMQPGVVKNGSNGEVTSETNTSNAVVSGPYGNNGFANSIETGEESGGYNSTYTYANATDGTRNSNCDNLSVVLPVRLLEFTARTQGGVVLVAWKTTNEVDNDYFEVERSAGNTQWEVIGRVKGQNIPGVHQYRLTDAAPLEGIAYYRLKQKDFDGTFTYSEVRMVNNVPDELLKLYPNPAQSYISVSMAALRQSDITICDLLGKNITAMVTIKQTGNGTFQIDVQRLANGMYMLKAKGKVIAFVKG
ncbi:MAG: T9SS type A sorting domain-containing protein, partial [Agriterribacter sp.]